MKIRHLSLAILVSLGAVTMTACESRYRTAPPEPVPAAPTPEPSAAKDPSPPSIAKAPEPTQRDKEVETGLAIQDEELQTALDPETTAQAFAYYKLDDVQMLVLGVQAIDEYDLSDEVTQRLTEHFSEMGMRLQNPSGLDFDVATPESIRDLATEADADLVTIVGGDARERAKLGRMLSYEAEIRATIYEGGGDVVTSKEITKVGARSSRAERAAESALLAAADELGPYLSEQLLRKVGQNVITRRLVVTDLRYYASVTKIMAWLNRQDGINDVRLISWDARTNTARFIVYLQPAAKDNLGIYVTRTPGLDVRIRDAETAGTTGSERRITR